MLVDPGFPDMLGLLQAALPLQNRTTLLDGFHKMLDLDRACLALAREGALLHPATQVAKSCVAASGSSDRLDETLRQVVARQLASARVWQAMISETEDFVPTREQPSAGTVQGDLSTLSFGDKPLIVLTRGKKEGAPGVPPGSVAAMEAAWKAAHDRIAALSTRGVSAVVPDTGHYIQIDQPAAVIDAVRRVVSMVRGD